MNCTSKEDLISAINNHKLLFDIRNSDSIDDVAQRLELVDTSLEKVDGKYSIDDIQFRTTVTTEVDKTSKKPNWSDKAKEKYAQQALIGNFVHDSLQEVTNQLVALIGNKSVPVTLNYLRSLDISALDLEGLKKISGVYGKEIDTVDSSLINVFEGAKAVLLEVYSKQNQLNIRTKTSAKPKIYTEIKVLDPKRSIGGTLDFLAILSDKSVIIRDYKTKVPRNGVVDANGKVITGKKLVNWFDEQKYALQLGEYMKILRTTYGVVGGSQQIIPVKIQVAFNESTNKFGSKVSKIVLPGQGDSAIEKYIPFSEKTGFKGLDNLLLSIEERIKKLRSQVKTSANKDALYDRIDNLENTKKQILVNHSLDGVVESANNLIETVQKTKLADLTVDELLEIKAELTLLNEVGKSTYEYRQYLRQSGNNARVDQMEQQINNILGRLQDSLDDVNDELLRNKAVAFMEDKTGMKLTDSTGDMLPFTQEGMAGKYFYQLSQFENPVFQTLRRLLDEANYNKKVELDEILNDVQTKENAVFNWLAQTGRSRLELVDLMVNKETGNFHSKWNKDYASKFFNAESKNLPKFLTVPQEVTDWYNAELIRITAKFRADINLPTTEQDKYINIWVSKNSLETNKDGTAKYPDAWEKHKSKLTHTAFEESPEYKFISSVPELKAYYEMFEEYNKKFREMLGVDYKTLPNNFIPNIRKAMAERVDELGIAKGLGGTMENFIKQFGITEEDRDSTGTFDNRKEIPIFFTNPFRNKEGKIDTSEKSFQLGRSLMLFANMALNFREMNQIESHTVMLRDVLSERGEELITKGGKLQTDKVGNRLVDKLDLDMVNIYDRFVDMYLYGISVQPTLFDKDGKAEKALMTAKNYFSMKALGFNFVASTGGFLAAKYNTIIEGNKGVIYTTSDYKKAMTDSYADRQKFLALSGFFDPMGHRINQPAITEKQLGELSVGDESMRGWVNKYVSDRMLLRAFSIGDEYIDEVITASMAHNFYVDNSGNLRKFKNHKINDDGTISKDDAERQQFESRSIWNLFTYDGTTPKLNLTAEQQKNVIIDFRRAVQVGQSKIKGTIPEEDKAYWQSQIVGNLMMQFKSWFPGIMFERWGKIKYDPRIDSLYMGKFTALWQEFKSPESMMRAEYFKTLLIPKLLDLIKHLASFGYWKKADKYQKELLFEQWLDNHPQYRDKVSFEDFYIIQQQQLTSAMREIRVLLAFGFMIALLGADWDDDGQKDYKKYLLSRKLIAILSKMNQEMAFVYNPTDLSSMIKTPLPMLGMVSDLTKTMSNTVDELVLDPVFGEERLIGGTVRDQTGFGYYGHTLVPGGRILDFFDLFKEDAPR